MNEDSDSIGVRSQPSEVPAIRLLVRHSAQARQIGELQHGEVLVSPWESR
jgi:hypothetical protein